MNAPLNHHAVIARLREEIDTLEETVRQLREDLAPVRAFPCQWNLAPQQATILSCIIAASPGVATYQRIISALYPHGEPPDWVDSTLRVTVGRIRTRMRAAGDDPGFWSVQATGYVMTVADRDRLLAVQCTGPLPPKPRKPRPEPAWWAEIQGLMAEGLGSRKIARRLGRTRSTVLWAMNQMRRGGRLAAEANKQDGDSSQAC